MKITRYRPKSAPPVWSEVAPLVRSVVAAAVTAVPYDVERLLHVVGRLALWAEAAGLERSADAWLRNEVIDAFVLSRVGEIEGSSVRTYRTWLLRVRDALAWSERGEAPPARMHADKSPHQPYCADELAGLRHWATHLPRQQRTDALALLGLGAGLGLMPKEVAASRGLDLCRPSRGGPLLHRGVERLVPLVARAAWDTVLGAGRNGGRRLPVPAEADCRVREEPDRLLVPDPPASAGAARSVGRPVAGDVDR
ncbi:hypothetical protein [Streptomyces sp. NBC_00342]|uniref:hypothetical protein n=1 Tax=Streptomyces sp. NBC_00342 TaxID=2975718 RepID=UPI002E2B9E76|nr:hypothetical protein [Streptomyces sp. NBC_00342]